MTSADLTNAAVNHELFGHVRSVIGVVVGLSIGRLLQGVASIIEHPGKRRIWWVHLGWVAWALLFVISFWWWEFELNLIYDWTITKFFFIFLFSGLYYMSCSLLIPNSFEDYEGYQDYFLSRRRWFFGLIAAITIFDVCDSLLKGMSHVRLLGAYYPFHVGCLLALSAVGALGRRVFWQPLVLAAAWLVQLGWVLDAFYRLS